MMKVVMSVVVAQCVAVLGDMNVSADIAQDLNASAGIVHGKYATETKTFSKVFGMDITDQEIELWYPVGLKARGKKFPFISYAHGAFSGGPETRLLYGGLMERIAAFGYVIGVAKACVIGCSDLASLPGDPPGFAHFYEQQLKVIDWAKKQGAKGVAPLKMVNFDLGVGIAGHSMGGQATVYSSSSHGAGHDIKAAVMHHAYTHSYPAPTVPFLAFTGTSDVVASPSETTNIFNSKGANPTKALANKRGSDHLRPSECSIPGAQCTLAPFTAAWFKIYLDGTPQADGNDYDDMIFGSGRNSLCFGGQGTMAHCETHRGLADVVV